MVSQESITSDGLLGISRTNEQRCAVPQNGYKMTVQQICNQNAAV